MGSRTIFVAEDDNAIRDLLRIRLEVAGYNVHFARDGQAAIDGIMNLIPNGVVLDIGLPQVDGFEVLKTIRSYKRTKDVPVLMLTARHDAQDVKRAIAAGAQDYLAKPFED